MRELDIEPGGCWPFADEIEQVPTADGIGLSGFEDEADCDLYDAIHHDIGDK